MSCCSSSAAAGFSSRFLPTTRTRRCFFFGTHGTEAIPDKDTEQAIFMQLVFFWVFFFDQGPPSLFSSFNLCRGYFAYFAAYEAVKHLMRGNRVGAQDLFRCFLFGGGPGTLLRSLTFATDTPPISLGGCANHQYHGNASNCPLHHGKHTATACKRGIFRAKGRANGESTESDDDDDDEDGDAADPKGKGKAKVKTAATGKRLSSFFRGGGGTLFPP